MTWHPVALSATLGPGRVTGARVLGAPVAVWRDAEGRAHVWEDRCPHRGMRLSLGFVREGVLTCLYHGWRFGPEGSCRHIPAHPEITPPETIRASRHPAAEAGGLVWAMGEGPPPDPGPLEGVRSVTVEATADAAHAALGTLDNPFAPDGTGDRLDRASEGAIWRFGPLAVAVLDAAPGHSVLHGLAAPAAGRDARRRLAAGLAALRRALEAAP